MREINRFVLNDMIARPLGADDLEDLNSLIINNRDIGIAPKSEEWIEFRRNRNSQVLTSSNAVIDEEIIGTFRDNELIAIVDMVYGKQLPFWYNVFHEAKYPSSNSLSRDLIFNGIAAALNLACYRAEFREYFVWYSIRSVRDTRAFYAMLRRSNFDNNSSNKHYYEGRGRYEFYPESIVKAGSLPKYPHHKGLMHSISNYDSVVTMASLKLENRLEYIDLQNKISNK